jgi:hypothetical protein
MFFFDSPSGCYFGLNILVIEVGSFAFPSFSCRNHPVPADSAGITGSETWNAGYSDCLTDFQDNESSPFSDLWICDRAIERGIRSD